MEAALFMLDCLALLWLCYLVVKNEREPGRHDLGIFRYVERRDTTPKAQSRVLPAAPSKASPRQRGG